MTDGRLSIKHRFGYYTYMQSSYTSITLEIESTSRNRFQYSEIFSLPDSSSCLTSQSWTGRRPYFEVQQTLHRTKSAHQLIHPQSNNKHNNTVVYISSVKFHTIQKASLHALAFDHKQSTIIPNSKK